MNPVVLRRLLVAVSALFSCCPSELALAPPQRNYAGSMTASRYGIVATSQAVASQAGASISRGAAGVYKRYRACIRVDDKTAGTTGRTLIERMTELMSRALLKYK